MAVEGQQLILLILNNVDSNVKDLNLSALLFRKRLHPRFLCGALEVDGCMSGWGGRMDGGKEKG